MTKDEADLYIDRVIKRGYIPFSHGTAVVNGVGMADDKWYFICFSEVLGGITQDPLAIIDQQQAEKRFPLNG